MTFQRKSINLPYFLSKYFIKHLKAKNYVSTFQDQWQPRRLPEAAQLLLLLPDLHLQVPLLQEEDRDREHGAKVRRKMVGQEQKQEQATETLFRDLAASNDRKQRGIGRGRTTTTTTGCVRSMTLRIRRR